MKQADAPFVAEAIELATRCPREHGGRDPMVAAVVVRDGGVVSRAHRGEGEPGQHAEFIALDVKPEAHEIFAGATLYATLEPCTERGVTLDGVAKIPCAQRIIDRRIKRVVIGMLDPNPAIRGQGVIALRRAGIEVELFDADEAARIEDLNREFIRHFNPVGTGRKSMAAPPPAPMPFVMRVTPEIAPFLTPKQRHEAVLTLDIVPDVDDAGSFRLDFDCQMRAVRVFDERTKKLLYYVGVDGAQLILDVADGDIVNTDRGASCVSPDAPIVAEVRPQRVGFVIESTSLGPSTPVRLENGERRERITHVTAGLGRVDVFGGRRSVQWDFLIDDSAEKCVASGAFNAFANVRWVSGMRRRANVVLSPDAIEFFDDERRSLGWLRSLLMWRALKKHTAFTDTDVRRIDLEITDG